MRVGVNVLRSVVMRIEVGVMMKGVGAWQPGHPWSVCPGRKESQRLDCQIDDRHPLKDNGQAYAYDVWLRRCF